MSSIQHFKLDSVVLIVTFCSVIDEGPLEHENSLKNQNTITPQ